MDEFLPFFTNDGSVGLYSYSDNDIYHSVYGAVSEAYDKFILPANFDEYFLNKNEIRILDLCYGIGYNTKSFLNYFFKKTSSLTECNCSIGTNNIQLNKYNYQIYTNNVLNKTFINNIHANRFFNKFCLKNSMDNIRNYKIKIDAVDTNEILMKLSPFFITDKLVNKKHCTGINKIDRYQSEKTNLNKNYNITPEVNMLLLHNLLINYGKDYLSDDLLDILYSKKYDKFFSDYIRRFMAFYFLDKCIPISLPNKSPFLHNIYYKYLSKSYKNTLKVLENNDISIRYINFDARKFLTSDNSTYDFIFLDAFTPSKCPNLWTYEFFKLLYNHLSDNGKILTYSNSASIRNAMIKNKFFITKIYNKNENKFTGTLAVKNPNLINSNLDDYDIGLLHTKAGIMYRDYNLDATNQEIINNHNIEFNNSNLISSTQFKNQYKENIYGI